VTYGHIQEIADAPPGLIDRLRHYFLSYKQLPQDAPRRVEIADVYDRTEAEDVIRRSIADYRARYGSPDTRIAELRRLLGE
jgi:inorganic pyrophosphatase